MKTLREILENVKHAGQRMQMNANATIGDKAINQALLEIENYKSKVPSVEEMSEVTSELVEEHFPKGKCKERGQAIVLHAIMLIKIHELLVHKER